MHIVEFEARRIPPQEPERWDVFIKGTDVRLPGGPYNEAMAVAIADELNMYEKARARATQILEEVPWGPDDMEVVMAEEMVKDDELLQEVLEEIRERIEEYLNEKMTQDSGPSMGM